jgi:hypothetical protein
MSEPLTILADIADNHRGCVSARSRTSNRPNDLKVGVDVLVQDFDDYYCDAQVTGVAGEWAELKLDMASYRPTKCPTSGSRQLSSL